MKLYRDGIVFDDRNDYHFFWWNWLPKNLRYFGYVQDWYDGPLSSFGFWFINWTWKMPWTSHDGKGSFLHIKAKNILDNQ